jgi:hypothetical protein
MFYGRARAYPIREPSGEGGADYHEEAWVLIKNPNLKNLQMFKAFHPNLAFQEIESFLTGVLPNPYPPTVVVSEKTRIAKRGFDKWSFRKPPAKKKD